MKTAKILTILVVALGLILCQAKPSEAAPMGTSFTYQGHLYDNNSVADGEYDFRFSLYDVNVGGAAVANDVIVHDMDVIDGYFTVELDFGSGVFDANALWLETAVRPGDSNGSFTTLSPREKLTPTPYALYAATAAAVPGGTTNYIPKFIQGNRLGNSAIYESDDNIGIGTTEPDEKLHVVGGIKIDDGSQGTNKVLTSDANGVASWQAPPSVPSGVIVMWSGNIVDIPDGWVLCDGTNGTPDLTSRFIRSVPNASTDPGSTGGSSSHTHGAGSYSAASHTHTYSGTTNNNTATKCQDEGGSCDHTSPETYHSHTYSGTTNSGGGGAISGTSAAESSLPPYYELAFIMKL